MWRSSLFWLLVDLWREMPAEVRRPLLAFCAGGLVAAAAWKIAGW